MTYSEFEDFLNEIQGADINHAQTRISQMESSLTQEQKEEAWELLRGKEVQHFKED